MRTTNRSRAALAVTALLIATVGLGARAGAQDPGPTWTIAPTSPTALANGEEFTASGTGCLDPDTQSGTGMRGVVQIPRFAYPNQLFPDGLATYLVDAAPDGTWSLTGAPDTREEIYGPFGDFDTTATAGCIDAQSQPVFTYEQTYTMRYDGTRNNTTTTAVPTTATPTTTAVAPPSASPAAPVDGAADFTG